MTLAGGDEQARERLFQEVLDVHVVGDVCAHAAQLGASARKDVFEQGLVRATEGKNDVRGPWEREGPHESLPAHLPGRTLPPDGAGHQQLAPLFDAKGFAVAAEVLELEEVYPFGKLRRAQF